VVASDVWARRDRVRATRRHDDDWYFERFPMDGGRAGGAAP
jgi:hypothetical protein